MSSNLITSSTCKGEYSGKEEFVLSLFLMTCKTSSPGMLGNRLTMSKLQGSLHFESWYPVLIILSVVTLWNFVEFRFSWLGLASHLTFLMKCKVHDVPKGLPLKASCHSHCSSEIILQGEDRDRIQSLKHCALNKNRTLDNVQKHIICKYCINLYLLKFP
jgi:hypothetical protein